MSIHIEGKGLIALTTRANNRPTVTRIVVIDYHISGGLDFFVILIHRNPISPRRKGIFIGYLLSLRPKRTTGIGTGYRHGQQHGQNTGSQYIPFLSFHCILSKHKKSENHSFYSSINYFRSFIYILL